MSQDRRPTRRRIANITGLVAFAVVAAVLGLSGAAVALLDPGPTGEGPVGLVAFAVIAAASAAVGLVARMLALFMLDRTHPDGS
jgi:hypothetical protein